MMPRAGAAVINPRLLLSAYANGIFPMADSETGEIGWYAPERRAVFPLDAITVSRSLRRTIRKGTFEIRFDSDFESVVRGCADRPSTWISGTIERSYVVLHRYGLAHSAEALHNGRLVGGLYGVSLGGAFFGESMFSRMTDASKAAFIALTERLRARGYVLLDAQFMTDHLRSLGAIEISNEDYMRQLDAALRHQCSFSG